MVEHVSKTQSEHIVHLLVFSKKQEIWTEHRLLLSVALTHEETGHGLHVAYKYLDL